MTERLSPEEEDICDTLVFEGEAIMEGLGFKRLPDRSWREEDLALLFAAIDRHGFRWIYERIDRLGLTRGDR